MLFALKNQSGELLKLADVSADDDLSDLVVAGAKEAIERFKERVLDEIGIGDDYELTPLIVYDEDYEELGDEED